MVREVLDLVGRPPEPARPPARSRRPANNAEGDVCYGICDGYYYPRDDYYDVRSLVYTDAIVCSGIYRAKSSEGRQVRQQVLDDLRRITAKWCEGEWAAARARGGSGSAGGPPDGAATPAEDALGDTIISGLPQQDWDPLVFAHA